VTRRHIGLAPTFGLDLGGTIEPLRIAVSSTGNPEGSVIVALGGISAGADVTGPRGWWNRLIGPEAPIDSRHHRIVGLDFIGARGESGRPVPGGACVTTADQARALALALDHLGVSRVESIVGASYGGMVALAFARDFPFRVDRAVVISAAHEPHPMATALRSIQRRIVQSGVETGREREALELARALAMTTYRTEQEFAARFGTAPAASGRWPVEEYLEARGAAWAASWTAEQFLTLSLSLDLHHLNPEEVPVPVTLIAVRGDRLVPLEQMEQLYRRLPVPAGFHIIDSPYGHDAFLKEAVLLGNIFDGIFAREVV
jgi:homoserine O-acetyltransferase